MTYARLALATFANMLGTLDHILAKAQDAGMTDLMLAAKLADDMFPLELQCRVALNQVLLAFGQVGGRVMALEETPYRSLEEIRLRIAAIRSLVEQSSPGDWAEPNATVDLTLPNGVRFVMSAEDYLGDWILPNFYFHVTTAYALLRAGGLAIGKMDYLPHMARHRMPSSE